MLKPLLCPDRTSAQALSHLKKWRTLTPKDIAWFPKGMSSAARLFWKFYEATQDLDEAESFFHHHLMMCDPHDPYPGSLWIPWTDEIPNPKISNMACAGWLTPPMPWMQSLPMPQSSFWIYQDFDASLWQHMKTHPGICLVPKALSQQAILKSELHEMPAQSPHLSYASSPEIQKLLTLLAFDWEHFSPHALASILRFGTQISPWEAMIDACMRFPDQMLRFEDLKAKLHPQTDLAAKVLREKPKAGTWMTWIEHLKRLYQHLDWPPSPIFHRWCEELSALHEEPQWLHASEITALLWRMATVLPLELENTGPRQIGDLRHIATPCTHLYLPTSWEPPRPSIPKSLPLVMALEHQAFLESRAKRYQTAYLAALAKAHPLPVHTRIPMPPPPPPDAQATNLKNEVLFWPQVLRDTALCPKLGWIKRRCDPSLWENAWPSPHWQKTLYIQSITKGEHAIEDLFEQHVEHAPKAVNSEERHYILKQMHRIRARWQELLTELPWLNQRIDLPKTLRIHDQDGHLNIHWPVQHPEGLVLIHLKSTQSSLSRLKSHPTLDPRLPLACMEYPVVAIGHCNLSEPDFTLQTLSCIELEGCERTHSQAAWQTMIDAWNLQMQALIDQVLQGNSERKPWSPHQQCRTCQVRALCQPPIMLNE